MNKFFFCEDVKLDSFITVTGATARHIIKVLRMRQGEEAIFCDGACTDYYSKLECADVKKNEAIFSVKYKTPCDSELPYKVTLYQGLPSSDKLNFIIQKATELGVSRIVPVNTRFSQNGSTNLQRLRKISEMAACQSKRGIIPDFEKAVSFKDVLNQPKRENLWITAYENEKYSSISKVLKEKKICNIGIWIGPEGGFAEDEIEALKNSKSFVITLGRRILRTETAGISAMVQVQCAWNAEAL